MSYYYYLKQYATTETCAQVPCDGERPASWWRSGLIIRRRVGLRARWVRFPLSPLLRLGFAPCRSDQRTTRPCRQFLSGKFGSFLTRSTFVCCESNLHGVTLALFWRFDRRTTFCFHAEIVVQKIFASTLDGLNNCTTINTGEQQYRQQIAMIVISCQHESKKRHGRDRKGNQRFRCLLCGKTFTEAVAKPLGEMRISMKEATTSLGMILEGLSVRATSRLTGLHPGTICDLILHVGENCRRLLDAKVVDVPVTDVQLDEIWSFVGMKEKTRVSQARSSEWGDCWTFTAIERETKLVLAHTIGQRDMATCTRFLKQLDRATSGRSQLSTDGLRSYTLNVPFVLGNRVDFAQLIKTYASSQETTRYSPAKIESTEKIPVLGNPDEWRICTSHVERLNLTIRMNLRRFTRLTNGHSKSLKHHAAMQALLFAWYNFCRVHTTIRKTPAVASGIADRAWTLRELIENAGIAA